MGEKNYQNKVNTLYSFKQTFDIYGSLVLLTALLAFLVYFLFRGRRQRFEVTIILVMSIKYAIVMANAILGKRSADLTKQTQVILLSIQNAAGPIAHWTYASQYMKTCILVPGLVSKAKLLFERHSRTIENEFEGATSVDEFVRLHNEIDRDIKKQNNWYKTVSMAFVVVDFVLYVFLIAAFSSLEYQVIFHIGTRAASKILKMLAPVLEVIIALILAFCAFYLAEALKK